MAGRPDLLVRSGVQRLVIGFLAYVPLLLNDPGRVAADTKAYLYLDPVRLLAGAPYMWQPELGMGTVTHQNIGYLWPIGPFYVLGEGLGLPDWVVQRLWLGSILLLAGLGMRWFLRTIGWKGSGLLVASLAYMLSPYLLNYIDRHSVILLPWAGLPWLLGLTVRALRTPGWRHAALFGLVTLTIGGVNASSLLLVGLGPVAWIAWSALEGSVSWRRAAGAAARIGAMVTATGLWWMAGLAIQARYGLPTLRLTENYRVVSDAATAPETFRGLGYWYFYGQGRLGAWVEPATSYTRWALPLSYALPLLGLLVAACTRFRHRGHVLLLMTLGLLVAIGAHPYEAPSPLGRLFRDWTLSDAGLALRSTPRVLPLTVLGTAVLLGAGVSAIAAWRPGLERVAAASLCLLVVANLSPLWQGEMLGELVQRPEDVPGYWHDVAGHLDSASHDTRVLELPGADFSAYRWGNSGDPPLPGLMDRGHAARELIPLGTGASAALIVAIDTEIQEGRFDPDSLAPMARLIGAGDIVYRADLQYERFRTPRPPDLWADLLRADGLGPPVTFGDPLPNVAGPERPLVDEHTLARPPGAADPPPAVVFPVEDPTPILHTADADRPIVIAGDAEGVVAAAGAGLLEPGRPVLFSATLGDGFRGTDPRSRPGALLVLTDTNRRAGRRWGTIRETVGYTERADEVPLTPDLSDQRLAVLPDGPGTMTVAVQSGITAQATAYGNPVTFTPGDRPFHAVDGLPYTAWTVGAFNKVIGERLVLGLGGPSQVRSLRVVQAVSPGQNRWITGLRIHLDGETHDMVLDDRSREAPGQVLTFPTTSVSTIQLEVTGTDVGRLDYYAGVTGVGFAEVSVAGPSGEPVVAADETILLPTDMLGAVDGDSGQGLAILLSRRRSDPLDPIRSDQEVALDRPFELPWARSFDMTGDARLSALADATLIDGLLGEDSMTAGSSGSLPGDPASRPSAAFDGDPATAWQTPFGDQAGAHLDITLDSPATWRDLTLTYIADRLHSVPVTVSVFASHGLVGEVDLQGLPVTTDGRLVKAALDLPEFTSSTFSLRIDAVSERRTMDWYSGLPSVLPIGIAEIDGLGPPRMVRDDVDTGCRDDLLILDGEPLPISIVGTAADAVRRQPLTVALCGGPVPLAPGSHRLAATPGRVTGLDLDRLHLFSPGSAAETTNVPPLVSVTGRGRTGYDLSVTGADGPFWLVLGQSHSAGWELSASGARARVEPMLIDAYANGWLITPAGDGRPLRISLRWAPQRLVWSALLASLLASVLAFVLAVRGRRDPGPTPDRQVLLDPLRRSPVHVPGVASVLWAAGLIAFCALNLPSWPVAAPLIGLAFLGVLRGRLPQRTASLGAFTAMAAAATLIAVDQIRFRYPRDFVWPLFFDDYHVIGVVAILCIGTAALTDLLDRRCRQES